MLSFEGGVIGSLEMAFSSLAEVSEGCGSGWDFHFVSDEASSASINKEALASLLSPFRA